MSDSSNISWTESSWNPLTGCSKISEGCDHCYAHDFAAQLQSWGNKKYERGMEVNLHDGKYVNLPRKWRKPRRIFVDSMCDLFHEDVPREFILDVWKVMRDCPHHTFQVLTKRAERMNRLLPQIHMDIGFDEIGESLENVWLGVTTENQNRFNERMKFLEDTDAVIRWISIEPMLGPIDISNYDGDIDWVVVGGETAPNGDWREMKKDWVYDIQAQCDVYQIPFFFKGWGGKAQRYMRKDIDGVIYNEYPS